MRMSFVVPFLCEPRPKMRPRLVFSRYTRNTTWNLRLCRATLIYRTFSALIPVMTDSQDLSDDQRGSPRIQLPFEVELSHPSLGRIRTVARDISETGIFV